MLCHVMQKLMLGYAMLTVLRSAMICYDVSCIASLCYAMLGYAMPCCRALRYAKLCNATQSYDISATVPLAR